jgi:hypothetical protein
MLSSVFRPSWPICERLNVSGYVHLNSLMLFSTYCTTDHSAALFESAPLAPDRAQPLVGNDHSSREIFISSSRRPSDLLFAVSQLHNNPLPLSFAEYENARPRLLELFSVTTHIGMIRDRATTVCFAMQDLELPAPLTLEILDALFPPNNIRMWAKWELITTIKHFHQRHKL